MAGGFVGLGLDAGAASRAAVLPRFVLPRFVELRALAVGDLEPIFEVEPRALPAKPRALPAEPRVLLEAPARASIGGGAPVRCPGLLSWRRA